MMILLLMIAAVAIGLTLLYTSILDIRDRRVPFRTWYPMLIISIPAAVIFYLTTSDWTLAGRFLIAALIFSGFFPFSVLIDALIFALIAPLGIFLINRSKGNSGPLICQFMGFPVKSTDLTRTYGFVMEEFSLQDGTLQRRYFGFFETLRMMLKGTRRVYTRNLRLHPEEYVREMQVYKKAGTVWISYAVPFLVPITAGFLMALTVGDPIFWLIVRMIAGV
jgi:archaeal preflagellin peptidase FlaK